MLDAVAATLGKMYPTVITAQEDFGTGDTVFHCEINGGHGLGVHTWIRRYSRDDLMQMADPELFIKRDIYDDASDAWSEIMDSLDWTTYWEVP